MCAVYVVLVVCYYRGEVSIHVAGFNFHLPLVLGLKGSKLQTSDNSLSFLASLKFDLLSAVFSHHSVKLIFQDVPNIFSISIGKKNYFSIIY